MSVLETAIGWLAPPDCIGCGEEGSALCGSCSAQLLIPYGERCWRCGRLSEASRTCETCRAAGPLRHVFIGTAYDGTAQQLVRLYKFSHQRLAAKPIAALMAAAVVRPVGYIVIPVPTATSRVRERGFAHSERLAKQLAAHLRLEYSPWLRRIGQSRQLGAPRDIRLKQLDGSFAVRNQSRLRGQKVLLVDDVLTTGGTLLAAARILKAAGAAEVSAAVFAKRL